MTPSAPSPADLLDIARRAAHEAAEHIRSLDRSSIEREDKTSAHDIVTAHDRACEEIVVAALTRDLPRARIVGEEGGARDAVEASGTGRGVTFYVDPIDGTSNFAAGLPLFCVSIGVAVGRELVAGVVDAPILGQVFTTDGDGARLNGEPLPPRPTRPARDALVLAGFPGPRDLVEDPQGTLRDMTRLGDEVSAVRQPGSAALELAWVAAGWADAAMHTRINAWDVAAGFALVRGAGGSIRTWPGERDAALPAHEHPAYVACTGQGRIPVLDEIGEAVQARRAAAM